MKRGFLNNKKAAKPIGTAKKPGASTKELSVNVDQLLKIDSIPQDNTDVTAAPGLKKVNLRPHDPLITTSIPLRYIDEYDNDWPIESASPDFPNISCECLITPNMKSRILSMPGFPEEMRHIPGGKPFVIRASPGKGMGMFATRKIAAGELIADERPLMVTPRGYKTAESREKELESVIYRMLPESRSSFMALANNHLKCGSGPILRRVMTNTFGISEQLEAGGIIDSTGEGYGGFCATHNYISRMNHSCNPSTCWDFNIASFSTHLRAVRDIASGEEITTCYCDDFLPAAERQKQLALYSIKCTCNACLNPSVSDAKRLALSEPQTIEIPLGKKYLPTERLDQWIEPALKLLKNHEDEGMEGRYSYASTLFRIYNAYIAIGDAENAAKYGKKMWARWQNDIEKVPHLQNDVVKDGFCEPYGARLNDNFGVGKQIMLSGETRISIILT